MGVIHVAAETGNCLVIIEELKKNPDIIDMINSRSQGLTPLQYAAISNQYEAAKLLLEKGADINKRSKNDMTAFIYILLKESKLNSESYFKMIDLLLQYGAQLEDNNPVDNKTIAYLKKNAPALHEKIQNAIFDNIQSNTSEKLTEGRLRQRITSKK